MSTLSELKFLRQYTEDETNTAEILDDAIALIETTQRELERVSKRLWVEAKHWQDHPDYFTLKRPFWEGRTYKEARVEFSAWLDERANQQRATHTDIVLRDAASRLHLLAEEMTDEGT